MATAAAAAQQQNRKKNLFFFFFCCYIVGCAVAEQSHFMGQVLAWSWSIFKPPSFLPLIVDDDNDDDDERWLRRLVKSLSLFFPAAHHLHRQTHKMKSLTDKVFIPSPALNSLSRAIGPV